MEPGQPGCSLNESLAIAWLGTGTGWSRIHQG